LGYPGISQIFEKKDGIYFFGQKNIQDIPGYPNPCDTPAEKKLGISQDILTFGISLQISAHFVIT